MDLASSGADAATEQRCLRDAFGCFPTGVAVVTARRGDGTPVAITVNSFASLSLQPPLLQFALHARSSVLPAFAHGAPFCLSVLRETQRVVSEACARPGKLEPTRVPLQSVDDQRFSLVDALAMFTCRVDTQIAAGDHVIVIGAVDSVTWESNGAALAYFRGRYAGVHLAGTEPGAAPELAASLHALGWG